MGKRLGSSLLNTQQPQPARHESEGSRNTITQNNKNHNLKRSHNHRSSRIQCLITSMQHILGMAYFGGSSVVVSLCGLCELSLRTVFECCEDGRGRAIHAVSACVWMRMFIVSTGTTLMLGSACGRPLLIADLRRRSLRKFLCVRCLLHIINEFKYSF